ncbi:unnamed protein product [Rhizophagus irregularis]|uniref:Uncharacterized protein n=1 Tax=Rhizophagus irregularis TaxID=588596 RepID=A0A916E1P3_9GLOM|nr:unnamed protein product [Rhizophagus irregularis]CAB4480399.1 unnamed protein product [Rhizophagus irregularis]CAB5332904.1 unnamed protein product [Rhizophagus irregularis]CAB5355471.1 unnamed protein product [Rhizophagus irregularis]
MTSTTLTSSSTLSQETSMSSFELTQEVLEAARDSLLEQETQIILAENISRGSFNTSCGGSRLYVSSWRTSLLDIADATIRPWNVPNPPPARACNSSGYEYPTMVVEVGLIQSIHNLHELAQIIFLNEQQF